MLNLNRQTRDCLGTILMLLALVIAAYAVTIAPTPLPVL